MKFLKDKRTGQIFFAIFGLILAAFCVWIYYQDGGKTILNFWDSIGMPGWMWEPFWAIVIIGLCVVYIRYNLLWRKQES